MKSLLNTALALFALGGLAVFATPARAQDEGAGDDVIVKKDGSKQVGKITSEDVSGLQVMVGKAGLGLKWGQIKSVSYNPGGSNFNQAKSLVENGLYEEAIKVLEALKAQEGLRPILKPHVLNFLGLSYYRLGDFDKAVSTMEKLFADSPKTQLLVTGGGETLINCYLAKNNDAGAKAALDKLTQSAGADASLSLNLLKGRVLEKNLDFSGAAAAYKVVADSGADDATKAGAELGLARCLQGQKKPGEAQAKYKALVGRENAPAQVLSGAWNGLASVTYEDAVQKKDLDLMTSAMLQYMHGYVLYQPLAGEATTEYERAMRGSYDCFKALSEMTDAKDVKKANEKKYYAQKARLVREMMEQKFPKSPYLPDVK